MKRQSVRKRMAIVIAGLLCWFALMCSPIGEVIAIGTIFSLIIVFFVLGFINVQRPTDRN